MQEKSHPGLNFSGPAQPELKRGRETDAEFKERTLGIFDMEYQPWFDVVGGNAAASKVIDAHRA